MTTFLSKNRWNSSLRNSGPPPVMQCIGRVNRVSNSLNTATNLQALVLFLKFIISGHLEYESTIIKNISVKLSVIAYYQFFK